MDGQIRQLCCHDIGGNHQRLHNVRTQHVGVTFKHLLMPVWLGAYRYRDQPYRVLVNARTGKVFGTRPYSVAKIVMLILAILLIIGMIFGMIALAGGIVATRHADASGQQPPHRVARTNPFSREDVVRLVPTSIDAAELRCENAVTGPHNRPRDYRLMLEAGVA